MELGKRKVVKTFKDDREMMGWLTNPLSIPALQREYPAGQWSAHIDMVDREVYVTKKETQ